MDGFDWLLLVAEVVEGSGPLVDCVSACDVAPDCVNVSDWLAVVVSVVAGVSLADSCLVDSEVSIGEPVAGGLPSVSFEGCPCNIHGLCQNLWMPGHKMDDPKQALPFNYSYLHLK